MDNPEDVYVPPPSLQLAAHHSPPTKQLVLRYTKATSTVNEPYSVVHIASEVLEVVWYLMDGEEASVAALFRAAADALEAPAPEER